MSRRNNGWAYLEDQRAKDDLGTPASRLRSAVGGGTFESADAIFKLPPFGFKAVDFLLMGRSDFH